MGRWKWVVGICFCSVISGVEAKPVENITEKLKAFSKKESAVLHLEQGEYIIDETIPVSGRNLSITGSSKDKTIILYKPKKGVDKAFSINSTGFKISNLTIDGNNNQVNVGLIEVGAKGIIGRFSLENVVVRNIRGKQNGTKNNYGVLIYLDKVERVDIIQCGFENISSFNTDDKEGEGDGFCGGIFFLSNKPLKGRQSNTINIKDCSFVNIFTENSMRGGWDADAIRFYGGGALINNVTRKSNIVISGCNFVRVQKSAIKVSGINGMLIRNNIVLSDSTMLCAFRIQWGKNVIIEDNKLDGKYLYGLNLVGKKITVRNNMTLNNFSYIRKGIEIQERENIKNKNINIRRSGI